MFPPMMFGNSQHQLPSPPKINNLVGPDFGKPNFGRLGIGWRAYCHTPKKLRVLR